LQDLGHTVALFTPDFDPRRSFPATTNGRLNVHVHGQGLPAQVGSRLRVPCAVARTTVAAWAAMRATPRPDVMFCDLVSHVIPLLRTGDAPVLFYCHFPDFLLTPPRHGLYHLYRAPLDRLEEWSTGKAHRVLVNSQFTAGVFRTAFPHLPHVTPQVVYPGVACPAIVPPMPVRADEPILLLSINRFDPKKNLSLAIEALAILRSLVPPDTFARTRLILAGGYDARLAEQRAEMEGLRKLAAARQLEAHVELIPSPSDARRDDLLAASRAVIYTPEREHLGLVPLEAMAAGRPVVATDSGGPRETIVRGVTGFLCPPSPEAFAIPLARLVTDVGFAIETGRQARQHVESNFALPVFGAQLDAIVRELARLHRARR
jgi:alpha-1,3/alpha-1,6-mannosyltransferase